MAKKGKISCSSKSSFTGITFFWVDDKVKQGKTSIKHCPTNKTLAYLFTKALQGSKFKFFRRVIMV